MRPHGHGKRRSWSGNGAFWGYLMVAPTVVGLIVLNIIPFFQTAYYSFTVREGLNTYRWVGGLNYGQLVVDTQVWQSVTNTVAFGLMTVPAGIFIALFFAVLLDQKIRARELFRVIYFLPVVVAPAAIAIVWRWMYNGSFGLINQFLALFNIEGPSWITNPVTALPSISLVSVWSVLGYNIILILASLQGVSKTYYEAATIDGARPARVLFQITIPLISPILFFLSITGFMNAIKQFDLVYMMQGSGGVNPAIDSFRTILALFYRYAFEINRKGYASTIVILVFVLIMIVTAVQFYAQRKWVHYET